MSRRVKLVLPGHSYIGPGNALEGEPIDKDDEIAQVHDNAYHQAKDKYNIVQEDDIAIDSFVNDALKTGNIHSAIGALGLGAKRIIESAIGVQYPRMPPTPVSHPFGISKKGNPLTAPQWQYALIQRTKRLPQAERYERELEAHQHMFRALGKHEYLNKFKNINNVASLATKQKYVNNPPSQEWDASWGDADDFNVDLFDQQPGQERAVVGDTDFTVDAAGQALLDRLSQHDIRTSSVLHSQPSAEKRPNTSEDLHTPKKQAIETQVQKSPDMFSDSGSSSESSDERMDVDSPSASIDENGPTNKPAAIPGDASGKVGETDPSQGLPVSAVQPASASGDLAAEGMATSGGGGGASPAPLAFFKAGGFKSSGGKYSYHNSFRCRSYGTANYMYTRTPTTATLYPTIQVSSLVDLPVSDVSFYMPYSVFAGVPMGTKITGVSVKVTPIGNSVSFDTNSSASGSAATSHTLYGMASVGLNNKLPTQSMTISRESGKPMIVSSASLLSTADNVWSQRLWGNSLSLDPNENASNNDIILPHTYLGITQPGLVLTESSGATTNRTNQLITVSNQTGRWPLNQYITVFPMAPHIGTPLINFAIDVTPIAIRGRRCYVNGLSTTRRFRHGATSMNSVQVTVHANDSSGNTTFPTPVAAAGAGVSSNDELCYITGNIVPSTAVYHSAKLTLPANDVSFDSLGGKVRNIPSINFGIEAVQANVPEAVASYINASCDYYIETTITMVEDTKAGDWNYGDGSIALGVHMGNHMFNPTVQALQLDNVPQIMGEKTYSTSSY